MLSFEEEGEAKIGHSGNRTPSIGHVGVAYAADEGNGSIADHGESGTGDTGMVSILAITDIAHIENAILDGPMMAKSSCEALEIRRIRPPTTDPGHGFLTAPLGVAQPLARAAGPAHPAYLGPMQFFFEIATQFTGRHSPHFPALDATMLFSVFRPVRGTIATQGGKTDR